MWYSWPLPTRSSLAPRLRWGYLIEKLAPHWGNSMVEIDPEGSCLGLFNTRLRSE